MKLLLWSWSVPRPIIVSEVSRLSDWRDKFQLYHRLLPLPQETNNVIGVSLLVALISFITNHLNNILSLLYILNAMAIIISRL